MGYSANGWDRQRRRHCLPAKLAGRIPGPGLGSFERIGSVGLPVKENQLRPDATDDRSLRKPLGRKLLRRIRSIRHPRHFRIIVR